MQCSMKNPVGFVSVLKWFVLYTILWSVGYVEQDTSNRIRLLLDNLSGQTKRFRLTPLPSSMLFSWKHPRIDGRSVHLSAKKINKSYGINVRVWVTTIFIMNFDCSTWSFLLISRCSWWFPRVTSNSAFLLAIILWLNNAQVPHVGERGKR